MLPFTLEKLQFQKPSPTLDLFNVQNDPGKLKFVFGQSNYSMVLAPNNAHMETTLCSRFFYRLVSVVEHFGRAGGGHYTVYRSVRSETEDHDPQWFCISDSSVKSVSEEDILAAEASLLFYERIV